MSLTCGAHRSAEEETRDHMTATRREREGARVGLASCWAAALLGLTVRRAEVGESGPEGVVAWASSSLG